MAERVITIRSWDHLQHYKDRHAPWVKIYQSLLTSESWVLGTDISRLVQVASILLALRYSNRIPFNFTLLKRVASLDCTEKQFNAAIIHLSKDFLTIQELPSDGEQVEHVASTLLASCPSEENRGEENRGEKTRASALPLFDSTQVEGLDPATWQRWVSYRKEIGKPIRPPSLASAAHALAKHGADQAAVVEQSIANTWQGLFALKEAVNGKRFGGGRPESVRKAIINPDAEIISAAEFRRREAEAERRLREDGPAAVQPRMVGRA